MPSKRTTSEKIKAAKKLTKTANKEIKTPRSKNTRSKKISEPVEEVPATQAHLKREDYHIIIEWLTNKKNYESCFGTGKAPLVGRPVKGKLNGYEMMAINLQNQLPSHIDLTP